MNFAAGWCVWSLVVSVLMLGARTSRAAAPGNDAWGLEEVSAVAVRSVATSVSIIFIGHFSQTYWLSGPWGKPIGERQKYLANDDRLGD